MEQTFDIPASLTPQKFKVTIPDVIVETELTGGTPIPPPNQYPIVTATSPGKVQLPIDQVLLVGSAKDIDGTIVKMRWQKITGPSVTMTDTDKLVCKLTNIASGAYTFGFTATDNALAESYVEVSLQADAVVIDPFGKVFPITATPRTDKYIRPGCGFNMWMDAKAWDNKSAVETPVGNSIACDYYTRFSLIDIQNDDGSSNWSEFDKRIHAAIDLNQSFSFGIMHQYSGVALRYPKKLHDLMQAEAVKDYQFSGSWVINWNSENYLTWLHNFNMAIADHIATGVYKGIKYKDVIFQIDVRGYGQVGEWWWDKNDPKEIKPTSASLKRIIDSHIKAFPDFQLCGLFGMFDSGGYSKMPADVITYAKTVKNNRGPLGIRKDHYGDTGYAGVITSQPELMERWKTAPILGEPLNDKVAVSRNCGSAYCALPDEVKLYHVNSIGNGNYPGIDAATIKNVQAADPLMGYRIDVAGGQAKLANGMLVVELNLISSQCPPYQDWYVRYDIGVSHWIGDVNLRLLQGAKTVSHTLNVGTVVAGSYDLIISVIDPNGYRRNLPLNSNLSCKITI